ncbi:Metabotropic glutamate receptor [Eumeta japonica]|uniref:Metabotropic glutamate receptor n=1 Tax=Eumeta variegata TaxID=151549 RepID=A0A4C1Z479_EUMVA|nr:Metabotropic glutamate receptor [Eumeta japonica]
MVTLCGWLQHENGPARTLSDNNSHRIRTQSNSFCCCVSSALYQISDLYPTRRLRTGDSSEITSVHGRRRPTLRQLIFGTGFCFTVVYAALLTKTNRISRIFNASKHSAKRPVLISPSSQLAICAALISIQVLIVVVWMVVAPARAMFHHPTREDNMLVCDSMVDASYMIAFFYPIVLILVCTVYAVLTRNIPEAFNESKHIEHRMVPLKITGSRVVEPLITPEIIPYILYYTRSLTKFYQNKKLPCRPSTYKRGAYENPKMETPYFAAAGDGGT